MLGLLRSDGNGPQAANGAQQKILAAPVQMGSMAGKKEEEANSIWIHKVEDNLVSKGGSGRVSELSKVSIMCALPES